jgi:AmmeMemoRadiSam system protein A
MLQMAAPHVPIVPLYVGAMGESRRREAARILARHFRPGDILIASSDLTHYGRAFSYLPFPANAGTGEKLAELDSGIIEIAGSLDSSFFLDTLRQLHSTVCGGQPVALLLDTLTSLDGDDIYQETLDYQTSAELTGDFQQSVSYASLGYFRAGSFYADEAVQHSLLSSARATLQHLSVTGERTPIPPAGSNPMLSRRAPIFVSLHEHGELYGCVGIRTRKLPLAEAVPEMALAAALDDPRFFRRARVPEGLDVEISLLTPMKRIRNWKSFRIGQDGAFLEHDSHLGLLLPQVAASGEYTETRFLEALSKKAGLRSGAYRESDARLSLFRTQVFGGPFSPKEPGFGTYAGQR